jgi:GNAT superfamily N-acetyltransferase
MNHFRETILKGGKAFRCFDDGVLVGYATIDPTVFGVNERHILLDQLFVSKDYRGKGDYL